MKNFRNTDHLGVIYNHTNVSRKGSQYCWLSSGLQTKRLCLSRFHISFVPLFAMVPHFLTLHAIENKIKSCPAQIKKKPTLISIILVCMFSVCRTLIPKFQLTVSTVSYRHTLLQGETFSSSGYV